MDFRKSFKDTSFRKAILDTTKGDLASPPEEVIHGPPDGFTVVREYFVDLEYGGKGVNDLGWWFGEQRLAGRPLQDPQNRAGPAARRRLSAPGGAGKNRGPMPDAGEQPVRSGEAVDRAVGGSGDRPRAEPGGGAAVSYRDGRGKWMELGQQDQRIR